MYLLVIVGLVASAVAKDLTVGSDGGSLKYDQNITASPTIWRHDRNVTYNVSDSEVITKVDIVDHREDKNGEAAIVEGGEGHKNVTIQLKSPAVFRGFDFEIRVYGKQDDGTQGPSNNNQQNTNVNDKQAPKDKTDEVNQNQHHHNDHQQNSHGPIVPDTKVTDKQVPKDVIVSNTQVPNGQDKVQHPIEVGQDETQQVQHPKRDVLGQKNEQKPLNPPAVPVQSSKDNKKSDEAQESKGFNPMTNEGDWKGTVDAIFNENKSGAKPGAVTTKPSVEPTKPSVEPTKPSVETTKPSVETTKPSVETTKPTTESDDWRQQDWHQIDINGDTFDITDNKKSKNVVEGQQTEKTVQIPEVHVSQQAKKPVNVPLPYVKL